MIQDSRKTYEYTSKSYESILMRYTGSKNIIKQLHTFFSNQANVKTILYASLFSTVKFDMHDDVF